MVCASERIATVALTLPGVGPTWTTVGGALHVPKLSYEQVLVHERARKVFASAQPALARSTLPGTHEFAGWPVHAVAVNAQYCVHVFFTVPQLPHASSTTVPGTHPPASSFSHAE
jgi:hypothetical protein